MCFYFIINIEKINFLVSVVSIALDNSKMKNENDVMINFNYENRLMHTLPNMFSNSS